MAVIKSSEAKEPTGLSRRLFSKIDRMSEEEKLDLLRHLGEKVRLFPRKGYILSVDYETGGHTYQGYILDIGMGGIFLEINNVLKIGQELLIIFLFRNVPEPFKVSGTVVWENTQGVGVEFRVLSSQQYSLLQSVIDAT